MKKTLIIIVLFTILLNNTNGQQCNSGGCTVFTKEYPTSGAPYTPTTSWQVLNNPATGNDALMNGGNWTRFNVVSGNKYEWTYCETYGGTSTSWDPQLTLFNNLNTSTPICFSTDVCGTNGLAPYISWTATFTGVVRLLTTAYISGVGGCQSNSGTTNKLAYRQIAGTICNTPGTPASASGTQTGQTSANLSWTAGNPVGSSTVTYYWVVGTSSSVQYGGSGAVAQGTTNGTSATTSALTCGTTYYLRVYAKTNCDGTSSGYRTSSSFSTPTCSTTCTTPGTPASALGTQTGQTSANLSWTAGIPVGSSTVTYYWVVGTSSSVQYGGSGVIAQGTTEGTSATTSALTCGTPYYLRVYAKTNCDGTNSGYKTSSSFTTTACSGGYSIRGIDLNNKGTINWQQVYSEGKKFAWAKATEGVTFDDDAFPIYMPNGISAGVVMGAYHYARPDNNAAVDEANHFLRIAGSYIGAGYLPPALDLENIEDGKGNLIYNLKNKSSVELTAWVQTWMTTVQNATGVAPILYTTGEYASYLNSSLNTYKLWIATYETSPIVPPTNIGNWTTWAFKQYSWTATVAGIYPVDLNVFNGDDNAFNNLVGGTTPPPPSLDCSNAISLTCGVPYNGTTVGGKSNVSTNGCRTWTDTGPEIVHTITTTSTGDITATLSNLNGVDLDVYILKSCNTSDCWGTVTSDADTYTNAPAGNYYILVDGWNGASGSYTLTVTANCGTSPILTVTPSSLTLGSTSNSSDQINVTSNVSWTTSDDAAWLTVTPASSSNNGSITVTATSENTSTNSRSGTVTISGSGITRTVSVTQSGTPITPALTVTPTSITLGSTSNSSDQINVTSNVSWTVSDDAAWLSVSPASSSNNGTITVTATSENTSTSTRSGTVTITGSGIIRTISVTQSGTPVDIPTATLTIGNISGSAGTTVLIPVSATKFSDVVSFQFTIVYDKTKLDYVSCSNWSVGTNVSDVLITPLTSDGKITFVYNNTAININDGKFFDLNFTIKANTTGTALLSWSDVPTTREISNSQAKEIPCTYSNGTLTIVSGFNLSGQLLYDNTAQSPLNDVSITLLNSNSQPVGSSTTGATGSFSIPGLSNGNYSLKPDVNFIWGGATAMDITLYKKHIGNVSTLPQLQVKSGDVNGSNSLTSMDLTIIKQRIGAQISSFTTGDWVYDPIAAVINSSNLVQNIKTLCYGDANGSYLPTTLKSYENVFIAGNEKIHLLNDGEFEIPFKLSKAVSELSSVTLFINYPDRLIAVKDIRMIANNEDLYYSAKGGLITVIYSTLNSLDLNRDDVLMTIRFSLKKDASQLTLQDNELVFSGTGEFGNYNDKVLDEIELSYATTKFITLINDYAKDEIKVYPNPAKNLLTVTNVSDSKINIIDILGRNLSSIDCQSSSIELNIRSLLPGTYTLRIDKNKKIIYRKFSVVK